ncbi:MAG: NrfD/PsrC family molybdoenzyme membrane anchor subunit [Dehalococcoidales bacterium]|nr:NrfD/PsrC family molybdoenzyme membrane anchor subunit [Dehalococcoidales bacterium]
MPGFVFPNEGMIEWDLLIVIYPYITGLVAGAFIVSSLYHVFGITNLRPVARFSLVTALAFLIVTPMPLVIHLGRPERGLEMFLTPNLNSAMSAFGYIWFFYLLIVLLEIWLVFRPDIVRYARSTEGTLKTVYSILALGVYDVSEESLAIDKKIVKVLSFIGIPAAVLLHGYVGFIFGAVKANPWWSTPLMPIIFLMSATVSGIALLIVLYIVTTKIRKATLDHRCLRSLSLWLTGFLSINVVLEGLEVFSMLYESEESWEIISQLITQKIALSYFGIQFLSGAILPLFVLGGIEIVKLGEREKMYLRFLAAVLVLIGVFAMRWNVVIGGQLISKSLRGFTDFVPPIFGLNGILTAAALMALPFLILSMIVYLIPPWLEETPKETPTRRFPLSRTTPTRG